MGPIDYNQQVLSPFQAALRGYQGGAAIRDDQMQQQMLQAKMAEQERARLAQQQMQQELAQLSANPNASARDYAAITLKYPHLREQAQQSWGMVSKERQAGVLDMFTRAYSAASSGRPDIAQSILTERAAAMRNSGDEAGAKSMEQSAEMIGQDPVQARNQLGMFLAKVMDPDKFAENFVKLSADARAQEEHPLKRQKLQADVGEAQSNAAKAAVAAKFAESKAVSDLRLSDAQIQKMAADAEIARMNSRIAAMNAQTAREGNAIKLKEHQLKIEEAIQKRDEKVREKVATAEAGAASIDNMLNTIERIKASGSLDGVLGVVAGRMPGMTGDASDVTALIDTLGSQAFLAQIPNIKGMGALSNAEGEKLQSALTSLKRTQSPKQFRANLDDAARMLMKGRANIERGSGVTLSKPDTPAKPTQPAGNVSVSGW